MLTETQISTLTRLNPEQRKQLRSRIAHEGKLKLAWEMVKYCDQLEYGTEKAIEWLKQQGATETTKPGQLTIPD